jgi:hypothetical protein
LLGTDDRLHEIEQEAVIGGRLREVLAELLNVGPLLEIRLERVDDHVRAVGTKDVGECVRLLDEFLWREVLEAFAVAVFAISALHVCYRKKIVYGHRISLVDIPDREYLRSFVDNSTATNYPLYFHDTMLTFMCKPINLSRAMIRTDRREVM